jgi:hypothetical protein
MLNRHYNPISGTVFSEKASALLALVCERRGYTDNRWVTRKGGDLVGGYVDDDVLTKTGRVRRATASNSIQRLSCVPAAARGVTLTYYVKREVNGKTVSFPRSITYYNVQQCAGFREGVHLKDPLAKFRHAQAA